MRARHGGSQEDLSNAPGFTGFRLGGPSWESWRLAAGMTSAFRCWWHFLACLGPDYPAEMSQAAPQDLVPSDQLSASPLRQRHIDHVVQRMIVIPTGKLPGPDQISLVIDNPDRKLEQQSVGRIRRCT